MAITIFIILAVVLFALLCVSHFNWLSHENAPAAPHLVLCILYGCMAFAGLWLLAGA